MTIKKRILTAAEELPLVRSIENILKKIQTALVALVATIMMVLVCLVIIAIYFLVHLVEGK
ncbi:MAG TPA: hypothetical protein VHA78_03050 [Candidatus Peribacteraceae bacterium]|nr:hypothetical protein [Candidatus Peribacteraceae bacterium]